MNDSSGITTAALRRAARLPAAPAAGAQQRKQSTIIDNLAPLHSCSSTATSRRIPCPTSRVCSMMRSCTRPPKTPLPCIRKSAEFTTCMRDRRPCATQSALKTPTGCRGAPLSGGACASATIREPPDTRRTVQRVRPMIVAKRTTLQTTALTRSAGFGDRLQSWSSAAGCGRRARMTAALISAAHACHCLCQRMCQSVARITWKYNTRSVHIFCMKLKAVISTSMSLCLHSWARS
mmetsp:Transcript_5273/g.14923  ORF Transcript_5273/g.14923 Transcript_5273/m.14923 type:complete len:235 (-) Transcript_5273:1338-2042(-)